MGFVGAGRMATALAVGLADTFTPATNIRAADPIAAARDAFARVTGCETSESNADIVQDSDIVFLAVKPQYLDAACAEISLALTESHMVISIVAGATIPQLQAGCGAAPRIVRVMPNTPALIGSGVSAIASGPNEDDLQLVRAMLETIGGVVVVPEQQMDAVTGLSGSGPAYVYQFIEALSDGGVRAGLPRAVATQMAAQTVLGAARMVLETNEHPAALKDAVASPGGTTIAGLHALEQGGMRGIVMDAVLAATDRSLELGDRS